ncbi:MAG: DUF1573 domain-containing protein [Planctomycetes bacterium]|nr:DUF1573 domain-containing protein [Planctomycetota bacterium]
MKTLLTLVVLCTLLSAQDGIPRAAVPLPVWKFGSLPQFSAAKHSFAIKNEGTGALKISQVIPSCQCAAAVPAKNELQPGEETTIDVSLDTKNFMGALTKIVTVLCNDPRQPQIILTITGEVLPPYAVLPREVNLGRVARSSPGTGGSFAVNITKGVEVHIKEVSSSNPMVEITKDGELTPQPDGSQRQVFNVRLKNGVPVGLLRESITILTDYGALQRTVITLAATIEGEVVISPTSFSMGRPKLGEGAEKEIEISKGGKDPMNIEGVEAMPNGIFSAAVKTVEEGRRWVVKVSVSKDAPKGYHRGTVLIRTNVTGEQQLRAFPYVYVVE